MRGKYKVAIVGSSGLVGRTVLKVLEEKMTWQKKNRNHTSF